MATLKRNLDNLNLISPSITSSAMLIADTSTLYAPLDASANYEPNPKLGTYLGAGVLPPTLSRVINYTDINGFTHNTPQIVSAALEINSNLGGFLNARMTEAQRNKLIATNGMQIYNTTADEIQFFESGAWIGIPATGAGDVSFVPPVPTEIGNLPVFSDLTGLFIKDSTVNISGGVGSATANINPVVGNQFSNISIIEFVTATNNSNDCGLAIERADLADTVYVAKLFRNDVGPSTFGTMVMTNNIVASSSSPNAILEIQSTDSCFLNARMTNAQVSALATPVPGMQLYNNNLGFVPGFGVGAGFMQTYQQGYAASGSWSTWGADSNGNVMIGNALVTSFITSANNCIFIGSNLGSIVAVNSNRVVIGNNTTCNTDDSMVIGGFKGSATYLKVGIGTQNPVAALHVNGSQALGFTRFISTALDGVITSDYTVFETWDYCIPVDCSGGTVTITLPANPGFGQIFIIKDVSGTAGTSGRFVNINPNGRTIDGKSPTLSMSIPYSSITIYSNGTNYFSIAGSYVPLPVGVLNEVNPLSYPYSVQLSDNVIFVDSSSARTINLPNATTSKGQLYFVKDATGSSATNNITVQVTGGANIDGALTATVDVNYGAIAFISNGTQYYSLSTDNVGGPLFPYREHGSGASTSLYMGTGYNTTNTGSETIIAGYGSGALMTGANSNTVFGINSLTANVNLPQNIVVGNNSFNALTTAYTPGRGHNICIGNNSANGLITATSVIVIGDAITVTDNIANSVVMGVGASVSVNNAIVLGNGHNVGISNSSPVYGLHNLASRGDNITNINNTNSPYTPDYTLDYNIFVDTSTGAVMVDLPTAPATGLTFVIKDVSGNSSTNNITINAAAGGTIDGAGSVVINNAYGAITVVASVISPNTNYAIV